MTLQNSSASHRSHDGKETKGTSVGDDVHQELKGNAFCLRQSLKAHRRGISVVRFSPNGEWLASASADKTIKIWHARDNFDSESTLQGSHRKGISDIAWSHDSKYIASASDDMSVVVWDVVLGKPMRYLKGHTNYVFCVSFNPQSTLIASGSYDESVRVWDVKQGKCLKTLPAHSDPVTSVSFSPDGTLIVSGSYDGLIRIWDTSTGQCLKTLMNDDDHPPISYVRFTPNGKYLLASTLDNHHRLWSFMPSTNNIIASSASSSQERRSDVARCVKTYTGHRNTKYCLHSDIFVHRDANAENQVCVVSGSEDGHIYLWDVQSRRILQHFKAHDTVTMCVALHPTLPILVSGGLAEDQTIKIWHWMSEEERCNIDTSANAAETDIHEDVPIRESTMI